MYKSKHTLPLVIIGVIVAALTAAQALLIDWLPPAASEQAGRTSTLLTFLFWSSAVFFVLITTVIIYSVWKFRAPKGDMSDGPPIHGNTKLEIVWTAVPSVLLVVVAIYGYIVLERNEAVAADALKVDVYAQQFAWSYGYPGTGIQTGVLVIPQGRQVELHVRARDVIHNFWVPEFGIKGDAVPGIDHVLWINPTTLGTYPVVCSELCGVGHSVMRSKVEVVTPAAFQTWLTKSKAGVAQGTAKSAPAATAANAPLPRPRTPPVTSPRARPSLRPSAAAATRVSAPRPAAWARNSRACLSPSPASRHRSQMVKASCPAGSCPVRTWTTLPPT